MLLSIAKDGCLDNGSKMAHYTQKSLLSHYSWKFLPAKPPGSSSFFIHVSTGHAYFSNDEIPISWVPMRPSTVFFSCRTPKKLARPLRKLAF